MKNKFTIFVSLVFSVFLFSCTGEEEFVPCENDLIPNAFEFKWEDTIGNGKFYVCSSPLIYKNFIIYFKENSIKDFNTVIKRSTTTNKILLTKDVGTSKLVTYENRAYYIYNNALFSLNLDDFNEENIYSGDFLSAFHRHGKKIKIINSKLYFDDYKKLQDTIYEMQILELDLLSNNIKKVYSKKIFGELKNFARKEFIDNLIVWNNDLGETIITFLVRGDYGVQKSSSITSYSLSKQDTLYSLFYDSKKYFNIPIFDIFEEQLLVIETNKKENRKTNTVIKSYNGATGKNNWEKELNPNSANYKIYYRKSNKSFFINEYKGMSENDLSTGSNILNILQNPYNIICEGIEFYNNDMFFNIDKETFISVNLNSGCLSRILKIEKIDEEEKLLSYYTIDKEKSMIYLYTNFRLLVYKIKE